MNGEKIFNKIQEEDVQQARQLLSQALTILQKFKATFATYQQKVPAWADVPKDIVFARLDAFIERCTVRFGGV